MAILLWHQGYAQGTRAVHKDAKSVAPDSSARHVHVARRFIHSPCSLHLNVSVVVKNVGQAGYSSREIPKCL